MCNLYLYIMGWLNSLLKRRHVILAHIQFFIWLLQRPSQQPQPQATPLGQSFLITCLLPVPSSPQLCVLNHNSTCIYPLDIACPVTPPHVPLCFLHSLHMRPQWHIISPVFGKHLPQGWQSYRPSGFHKFSNYNGLTPSFWCQPDLAVP